MNKELIIQSSDEGIEIALLEEKLVELDLLYILKVLMWVICI